MNDRLTSNWTLTLPEAFGETGVIGETGELKAKRILEACGMRVEHHPSDYDKQVSGIDLIAYYKGAEVKIDVKCNLKQDPCGDVCIEWEKFLHTQATMWCHVSKIPGDKRCILYWVKDMRKWIQNNPPQYTVDKHGRKLAWVPYDTGVFFVLH